MTSSNPPAGRITRTHDQIITKNMAIVARNNIHLTHRNKGKTKVNNDEPLITVPPIPPVIFTNPNTTNTNTSLSSSSTSASTAMQPMVPPSTPSPTNMNINAMILALAKIHATIFSTTSSSSSTTTTSTSLSSSITTPVIPSITTPVIPSITVPTSNNVPILLFDINNECTSSTSISDTYGIHTYIVELARCHQHIPLSILTMKVMTCLFLEPSTLKFVTHYTSHCNSTPMKCHILNVSQFPTESSISIGEWHKAWACFLKLLTDYASPEIHDQWARYHKDLREHADFEEHWPAILAFDMAQ
ncbi:uncharacterized protein EDB91DRAFT_1252830 [Suillus paluster]|uniref:uncharacterized protein n=1 Tax=Suillus paluster TaxID=48578 RepID=UPI001B87DA14|nr:uncharacterized protein EDB91DRAFT_1252830 [Suillus paluster]KAG1729953.1 hypothetical protein EDB91DRAFT_1252830 [Suillus paluster]